jgi:isoleucyl-tRNA synthetase
MKDRLYCEAVSGELRRRSQTVMYAIAVALTKLVAPMIVFTADEAWEHIPHKQGHDAQLASVHMALLPEPSGVEPTAEQKDEWSLLMKLRDDALQQLDKLKKEAGMNKALDAEVVFNLNGATRRKMEPYGVDLEDLVGAGYHSIVDSAEATPSVKIIDRRSDYPACARSWKRRPDVGQDLQYPDLSLRDAAAIRGLDLPA